MRHGRAAILLLSFAALALAQQPNSPGAAARWNGVDGPPWPIAAQLKGSLFGSATLIVGGGHEFGFILAWSPSGTVAPGMPTVAGLHGNLQSSAPAGPAGVSAAVGP